MTAIDELIANLQPALGALQNAVQAADSCWEIPLFEPEGTPLPGRESSSRDAWTPRDAAERATHGLALNVAFATQRAESRIGFFGDFRTAWRGLPEAGKIRILSMETSALTVAALADVRAQVLATLRTMPLERLTQPVEFLPGQDAYMVQRASAMMGDVATALRFSAAHMLDHAAQIQRAVDEL